MSNKAINGFRGAFSFMSNMYPCPVEYGGRMFKCSEAAYQSAKCAVPAEVDIFSSLSGPEAKKAGRKIRMRDDWDKVKVGVMREVLHAKFGNNPEMKRMLLATCGYELIEENTWHDNLWGDCVCERCKGKPGQNLLGKLLMEVRSQLQASQNESTQKVRV